MSRWVAVAALFSLLLAGPAFASDTKSVDGVVKAVTGTSVTVTDSAAKDWEFLVDKDTTVIAKGASHKMGRLKADDKRPTITEFITGNEKVAVKYAEKGGKMFAREVRVR